MAFRAAWWLRLKQLGYDVIPLSGGKSGGGKGWPKKPNDEAAIQEWSGSGAAVRMRGSELLVIDLDIRVEAARDQMLDWLTAQHPRFMAGCLRRHSGAVTLALIGRTITAKGTRKTARYIGAGTDPKGDFVEVFAGNSKRYVGVAGEHSAGRAYDYHGRHIIETPVDALPWLADDAIAPMLAAFVEIMVASGWAEVVPAIGREAIGSKVYDLLPGQIFTLSDGERITLEDLEQLARGRVGPGDNGEGPLKGHASLWDPDTGTGAHSNTRVLVTYGSEGLCLFDTKYEVRHRWKHREPSRGVRRIHQPPARSSEKGLAMSKQSKRPAPERPDDSEDLKVKTEWLLRTYAFCPALDKVVDMYLARALGCLLKREAFIFTFYGWNEPRRGANNKVLVRPKLATDDWARAKLIVSDVRMRPDMPFPYYRENGELFKNIYCQPEHAGTGDLAPFLAFMERFLPDRTQREWLYDFMAHKQLRPDIPGTAVLFVADTDDGVREGKFGTGRGMFFNVVHKLYGEEYSRAEDFNILDGTSGQAAYTDWRHNSVLITIDEAKSSPTSYRRGERSAVYEVLKNIVDPAPKRCRFKSKYGQAFDGMSYASYMVACNHGDAIAIPAHDRRFTVLINGREMTADEAKEFAAWMKEPGNIAELSRFLAARDLSAFNMFWPLDTLAKQEMAELALTQVEGILRDLMEDDRQELVFTRFQMEREVEMILRGGVSKETIPATGGASSRPPGSSTACCSRLRTARRAGSGSRAGRRSCTASGPGRSRLRNCRTRRDMRSARKRGGIDKAKDLREMSKTLEKLKSTTLDLAENDTDTYS